MSETRDFTSELKLLQADVAKQAAYRDKLVREEGIESRKVEEAAAKLAELGVPDADKLSVEEIESLKVRATEKLERLLAKANEAVARGNALMAEYEAVGA